jgi:hypothetical protein
VFRFAKHEHAAASLASESCLLPRIAGQTELGEAMAELARLRVEREERFEELRSICADD